MSNDNKNGTNARVKKRSIEIGGYKTSVSLEDAFWSTLKDIAHERKETRSELIATIDSERSGNLSSAIRLFVLAHYRQVALSVRSGHND
jgi:predicted DNA-binding ribbon-helix-helix protein